MNPPPMASRGELKAIARRTMIERGLLPDFSPAVLAETDAIASAATETDPSIRDLRPPSGCSIDNDESRTRPALGRRQTARGMVKIREAVADVDAVVRRFRNRRASPTNTTSVYTAAGSSPCFRESSRQT